jgi:hypothetical protein
MFWKKDKRERMENIVPAHSPVESPKLFQLNEEVPLFAQEFTLEFDDGQEIFNIIQEKIEDYSYHREYIMIKPSLCGLRNAMLRSLEHGGAINLLPETDTPQYISMRKVRKITFRKPYRIGTGEIVNWIAEET